MKGLLIKDFKILAKQKLFLFLVLLMTVIFTFGSDNNGSGGTYVMLIMSMFTLTTIAYDQMNGGMLFLLSLPANRKTYVKEKYVFSFLILMFALVLSLISGYAAAFVKATEVAVESMVFGSMGMVLLMGLMLAVAIPLEFKFGVEKGRMIVGITVGGVAFVAAVGYATLSGILHVDLIEGLAGLLSGIKSEAVANGIVIGGLFAVLLLILFCSYVIANKIMKKKEF